jgi:hypothetical protein
MGRRLGEVAPDQAHSGIKLYCIKFLSPAL